MRANCGSCTSASQIETTTVLPRGGGDVIVSESAKILVSTLALSRRFDITESPPWFEAEVAEVAVAEVALLVAS